MNQINIQYLKYDEIDHAKWDECMVSASNSLVYSQPWYLDKVCDVWDALVVGDYKYVMPITYRKKLNVFYLYQPIFCQQLGIFPTPTKEIVHLFFEELLTRFSFAEININATNITVDEMKGEGRNNFLLPLNSSYSQLIEGYSKHTKRKLKKAEKNNLSYISNLSIKEYLQFKKENTVVRLGKQTFIRLHNLLAFTTSRNMGQIYGVYTKENQLCAAVFFVRYKKRVTYLNAANSSEGKELNAMYFLIDRFIEEHAEKEYTIDFEGSMIPGVARLYEGFGASPEIYYHVHWNNLPPYIKWLKK